MRLNIREATQKALGLTPKAQGFPRKFKLRDVPMPSVADLKDDEVLLLVLVCCLCGTDKEMSLSPNHGAETIGMDGWTMNGHEALCLVIGLGPKVRQDLLKKLVFMKVRIGGRHDEHQCPECAVGHSDNCTKWFGPWFGNDGSDMGEYGIFELPGGFRQVAVVVSQNAVEIPQDVVDLDWRLGFHGDNCAIGGKCISEGEAVGKVVYPQWGIKRKLRKPDGEFGLFKPRVLILGGTGQTGIHAVSLLASEGWDVYAVGTTPRDPVTPANKIVKVERLGATYYHLDREAIAVPTDPGHPEQNPINILRQKIAEELGVAEPVSFDLIIDVCGAPHTIARTQEVLRPGEVFTKTSILPDNVIIDCNVGMANSDLPNIRGSVCQHFFEQAQAVQKARFAAWGQPRELKVGPDQYREFGPRALILGADGPSAAQSAEYLRSQCYEVYGIGTTPNDAANLGNAYFEFTSEAFETPTPGISQASGNPIEQVRVKVAEQLGVAPDESLIFDFVLHISEMPEMLARAQEVLRPYECLAKASQLPQNRVIPVNLGLAAWGASLNNTTEIGGRGGIEIGIVNNNTDHIARGFAGVAYAEKRCPGILMEGVKLYPDLATLAVNAATDLANSSVTRAGVQFADLAQLDIEDVIAQARGQA